MKTSKKVAKKPATKATKKAATKPAKKIAKSRPATKAKARATSTKPKSAVTKKATPKKGAPKRAPASAASRNPRGTAVLRAITAAMLADGDLASAEAELLMRFAKEPMFRGIDTEAVIEATIDRFASEGMDAIIADIKRALGTREDRETAFASCLAVTAADGKVTPSEVRLLRALRDGLGIPNARARKLAGPVAAAFA